ncbi:MAG: SAM-dependent methyltransferase [Ilumatobacteraceae bacterium]
MSQVPIEDFERRYQLDTDPWDFATSEYEQRRFDITAACLPAARYRRGFEPGCSAGELTVRLARRCDRLVSWDGSPTVVDAARRRVGAMASHVELAVGVVPTEWPDGTFDLVVLSEIGYYFDPPMLDQIIARSLGGLEAGGTLLAVQWLGQSADHLLSGDDVHEALMASPSLDHRGAFRDPGFRVDWWTRRAT